MGGEWKGVVGIWCVFVIREGVWGSDRENGDSLVSEVCFVCVDVCCVIEGLLMLLELDELDICNCDKGLNSIAIFVMVEID